MIFQRTSLSANVVQFCRYLRQKGFVIGVQEEAETLMALQFIEYNDPDVFRMTIKATLCRSKVQTEEFDDIFKDYWRNLEKALDAKLKYGESKKKSPFNQHHLNH